MVTARQLFRIRDGQNCPSLRLSVALSVVLDTKIEDLSPSRSSPDPLRPDGGLSPEGDSLRVVGLKNRWRSVYRVLYAPDVHGIEELTRASERPDPLARDLGGGLARVRREGAASPFPDAAVLTVDGVGEWATAMIANGFGETLFPIYQVDYPHSIGLLYSTLTSWLGFAVNDGEYKVMGLARMGARATAIGSSSW